MKVGIIGAGFVGAACAKAMMIRGSCHEIGLVDLDEEKARGLANDLSHGEPLCPPMRIRTATYDELRDAAVFVVTAGKKEADVPGAADPANPHGRRLLLKPNAEQFARIIPEIDRVAVSPEVPILVVTDPPDLLADVARGYTGNPVISAGTFLDTIRFRVQIGRLLGVHAASVDALVVGEHGLSQVFVWSTARVGTRGVLDLARERLPHLPDFRREVQKEVRFANTTIIKGTGASQHGIGLVTTRIVEAILRDERLVAPVGTPWQGKVTLSLPSVLGAGGVREVLTPPLDDDEMKQLERSAEELAATLEAWRAA